MKKWSFKSYFRNNLIFSKIGKDRCILLLLAGVLLLVVQTPASQFTAIFQKQEKTVASETEQKKEKGYLQEKEQAKEHKEQMEEEKEGESDTDKETERYKKSLEKELKEIFMQMEGVGKAEVVLQIADFGELVVEKDTPYTRDNVNETDSEGGNRNSSTMKDEESTVYIKDSAGNETPFITKEKLPEITGILVVCQGGDQKKVQSEIVEAMQALFGLDLHKIKVVKMKTE